MANVNDGNVVDGADDLLGLGLGLGLSLGLDLPPSEDLEGRLMQELPSEAKSTFLQSLGGLTPSESHDFCEYLLQLKAEKQFRVIQAMSKSPLEGKRKFLSTLMLKMAAKQAREKELLEKERRDLEEHRKMVEREDAANRVKKMNAAANKYHSFDAARHIGLPDSNGDADGAGSINSALAAVQEALTAPPVSRSHSAAAITKDDIREVSQRLLDTHITPSEMNLRELERSVLDNSRAPPPDSSLSVEMGDVAKRDRPESSRALIDSQNPAQRKHPTEKKPTDDSDKEGSGSGEDEQGPADDPEAPTTKRWTKAQDNALRESVRIHGEKNWKAIAEMVPGRNHAQCLQRWRKVLKPGLVKGHWSFEEDQMLEFLVTQGCNNWGQIAERIPGRTPKQCRERWKNHLDPAINKGPYTEEEDKIILDAQEKLGNRWSQIAQLLKGRTEDSVKIRWKSLKQNPAKAAASHAQQKKAQHQHSQHASYQQNPALMRQRQMQLIQQQQQLHHSEAAQLEQQQLRQQQDLQMRLHERVMQQQRAGMLSPSAFLESNGLPLKRESNSVDVSISGHHSNHPVDLTGGMYSSAQHADNGYDYNASNFSYMAAMAGTTAPGHGDATHPGIEPWELHDTAPAESYPPVQPGYWDHYGKPQGGMLPEPIPLTSSLMSDPSSNMAYGVPPAPEDEVYNEPVLEKFATEFTIGGMGGV